MIYPLFLLDKVLLHNTTIYKEPFSDTKVFVKLVIKRNVYNMTLYDFVSISWLYYLVR